ncbi:MAG: hypothetical protein LBS88_12595 [Tannerellaceae bacterium]|jgi:hypothetical protein|nr:hypothetical protein [Tannerellaceae bacterium]
MRQIQKHRKRLLYAGLGILALSFIVNWAGAPAFYFRLLLGVAILCKLSFLIAALSVKGFRPGWWLYLILAGVATILISMLFKTVFPIPLLRGILFYGAIGLKVAGLIGMIFSKKADG